MESDTNILEPFSESVNYQLISVSASKVGSFWHQHRHRIAGLQDGRKWEDGSLKGKIEGNFQNLLFDQMFFRLITKAVKC